MVLPYIQTFAEKVFGVALDHLSKEGDCNDLLDFAPQLDVHVKFGDGGSVLVDNDNKAHDASLPVEIMNEAQQFVASRLPAPYSERLFKLMQIIWAQPIVYPDGTVWTFSGGTRSGSQFTLYLNAVAVKIAFYAASFEEKIELAGVKANGDDALLHYKNGNEKHHARLLDRYDQSGLQSDREEIRVTAFVAIRGGVAEAPAPNLPGLNVLDGPARFCSKEVFVEESQLRASFTDSQILKTLHNQPIDTLVDILLGYQADYCTQRGQEIVKRCLCTVGKERGLGDAEIRVLTAAYRFKNAAWLCKA